MEARAHSASPVFEGLPCAWESCEKDARRVVVAAHGQADGWYCWPHAGRRVDGLNWAERSASVGTVAED